MEQRKSLWISLVPVFVGLAMQTLFFVWYMGSFSAEVKTELKNISSSLEDKASIESVNSLKERTTSVERTTNRLDRTVARLTAGATLGPIPEGGP